MMEPELPNVDFQQGHQVVPEASDLEQTVWEDYWGVEDTYRHFLPDGKQWFDIKKMTEGDRAKYQRDSGMAMIMERRTGDTRINVDAAKDRQALVLNAVENWNLRRQGVQVPFNTGMLRDWVGNASPALVDELIHRIRVHNPWLQEDLSVEELEKELQRIQELLDQAKQREAEKESSTSK
jgi:hypothetical protein